MCNPIVPVINKIAIGKNYGYTGVYVKSLNMIGDYN